MPATTTTTTTTTMPATTTTISPVDSAVWALEHDPVIEWRLSDLHLLTQHEREQIYTARVRDSGIPARFDTVTDDALIEMGYIWCRMLDQHSGDVLLVGRDWIRGITAEYGDTIQASDHTDLFVALGGPVTLLCPEWLSMMIRSTEGL